MTSVAILIFFVIFIIFVCKISNYKKTKSMHSKKKHQMHMPNLGHCGPNCKCGPVCKHTMYDRVNYSDSQVHGSHDAQMGLNELEQDTQTRGYVPYANQPDHVGNMWKTDQSQMNTMCNGDSKIYSYESDIQTPMRGKMVNMDVGDVSGMHIVSRFGSTSS